MNRDPIVTDRFILREIDERDVEGLFALDSDPEVHRYLGNKPQTDIKQAEAVIEKLQGQYAEHGIGRWAVIDKVTQDFMGWSGIKYEENVRPDAYYDIGYRFRKEFWGKGVASETASLWLHLGFTELDLDEICGGAHVDNGASNHILQKIGLQFSESFEFDGDQVHWYTLKNPNRS